MTSNRIHRFDKYEFYFDPVIILDKSLYMIFKNKATSEMIGRLQLRTSIKYLLDDINLEKLISAVKNKQICELTVNFPPPVTKCIVVNEKLESTGEEVVILIFLETLNLSHNNLQNSGFTDFLNAYRELNYELTHTANKDFSEFMKFNQTEASDKKYFGAMNTNIKKILRLQKHFSTATKSLEPSSGRNKYCDIVDGMIVLKDKIVSQVTALGYKVKFTIPDDIYIIPIEIDIFYSIVLTLVSFVLQNSDDGHASVDINTCESDKNGIISAYCQVRAISIPSLQKHIRDKSAGDLNSNDYLNLEYIYFMAKQNNMQIIMEINEVEQLLLFKLLLRKGKNKFSGDIRSETKFFSQKDLEDLVGLMLADLPARNET